MAVGISPIQLENALRDIQQHYIESWRRNRLIRNTETWYDVECDEFWFRIELLNYRYLLYRINTDEMRMGEIRGIHEWMRVIDHEVRRNADQHYQQLTATEVIARRRDEYLAFAANRLDQVFVNHFANEVLLALGQASTQDKTANKKAADLFRSVAGEAAYKQLEAGEGLPIKGSKGTHYILHKKASYCVERPSDGARLCAVVPGVPLWDHLLGIKLMVENDEPLFLKTANVSGGNTLDNMFSEQYRNEYMNAIIRGFGIVSEPEMTVRRNGWWGP